MKKVIVGMGIALAVGPCAIDQNIQAVLDILADLLPFLSIIA